MQEPQGDRSKQRGRGLRLVLDCLFLLIASTNCAAAFVGPQHQPQHQFRSQSPSTPTFFKRPSSSNSSPSSPPFFADHLTYRGREIFSEQYVATNPLQLDEVYHDISRSTYFPGLQPVPPSIQSRKTTIHGLTMWEVYWISMLNVLYEKSQNIKCPFGRRRFGDVLDNLEKGIRFFGLVRRDYQHLMGPPQACQPLKNGPAKTTHLPVTEVMESIRRDWTSQRGYYINGKLGTAVYRDDCLFDGPDPDMPVKGLRKYMGVAALLFDQQKSHSELVSLEVTSPKTILATWKMSVTIKIPWRPTIKEWKGTTTYHLDEDNLIYKHQETWELSVLKAFGAMMEPWFCQRLNGNVNESYH